MASNIPSEASYALCQPPSFNIAPGTDILLGTILSQTDSRPKRPDIKDSLNAGAIPDIDESTIRRPPIVPQVILDAESLRSGSSSIFAQIDFLPGIGGRLGGETSKQKVLLVYAQNVRTEYFSPSRNFYTQALKVDPVRDQLGDWSSPIVYLVTGIKIAERASIIFGSEKSKGVDVSPELDLSQIGIPVNLGVEVKHKLNKFNMVGTVHDQPFVLAYEARRIKVKADGYKQEMFRDFAVLDDVMSDEAAEQDFLNSLDIDLVTVELDVAHSEDKV